MLVRRWSPTWRYTPEDLEPVRNAFAAPGCLHAALGYYRAVHYRVPSFLKRPVEVPALVVGGTDDPGCPPELFERARPQYRNGYRVAMIPGGHFCHRESPQAFLDALLPFLETRR